MSLELEAQDVIALVERYREFLTSRKIGTTLVSGDRKGIDMGLEEVLEHCHAMLDEILDDLENGGKPGPARIRLAFVEGCLWARGLFSLDEIHAHSAFAILRNP